MPHHARRRRRVRPVDLPEAHQLVLEILVDAPDGLDWQQIAERAGRVGIGEDELARVLGVDGREQ